MMSSLQFLGALEMGLIYSLVALGVYISLHVIHFTDMTVDGSFILGASVSATLITQGHNPWVSTLFGAFAGTLAGLFTCWLHFKWQVMKILSGILTTTALYSINMRIMAGPSKSLLGEPSVFDCMPQALPLLAALVGGLAILLIVFLLSEKGLALRTSGMNPVMSTSYGVSVPRMTCLGLALSNTLTGLGGALLAQYQGVCEVNMGVGTVVIGLASVILGQTLLAPRHLVWGILASIGGALLYRQILVLALSAHDFGLKASDLNLISAGTVALATVLPKWRTLWTKTPS